MFRLLTQSLRRTMCKATENIERERAKISKFQLKNFSDSVRLAIKGGKGGNGMVSYFTSKRVRSGAPDGGDGGKGGEIAVQAHKTLHDLSHLRLKTIEGNDGRSGGATGKQGKNGGVTLLRVPVGTLVYEVFLQEERERRDFLADLGWNGSKISVATGGKSGKGNKMHPNMREQQKFGQQGQEKIIYLQLKTLADIGLVGFPNIGKSTFLAASTRALPKIANYEFTTLKPSVGHVKFVDQFSMTIADIPGIIEKAHNNKGLGLQFLRHIERTKVLVFMLDITHPDPLEQYNVLEAELAAYKDNHFKGRKRIVVFNKEDCMANSREKYDILKSRIGFKTFLISAKEGEGVGEVLVQLRRLKEEIDLQEQKQAEQLRIRNMNQEQAKP